MSRNKRKNNPLPEQVTIKTKKPFNKTILFKIFSIIILLALFLAPTLGMLTNLINPNSNSTNIKTQNIQVKN